MLENILALKGQPNQRLSMPQSTNNNPLRGEEVNDLEGTHTHVGPNLMANFLSLVREQEKLPPNHMMAMFGLYALVNILNLVQPEVAPHETLEKEPQSGVGKLDKDNLMDSLNGLLQNQGMNVGDLLGMLGTKSSSNQQQPGDILGALGKNPAALMNFMNLLTSAKEAMNANKKEEKPQKASEESKTVQFKERKP